MRADPTERLLRGLYSAALYLLTPITVYHLIWRGFRQPSYFQRWSERYARYDAPASSAPTIWVHTVSVGEVNAAAPLVDALLQRHPDTPLLITTITPTGSERVLARWGTRVQHVYLPYDLPGAVQRFLAQFRPSIALVMETELWPNLLLGCRDAGVPAYIVNGRLSQRSLRGYRVLAPLLAPVLRSLRAVLAQSRGDAKRFLHLGSLPECTQVTGNLKFDDGGDASADDFAQRLRAGIGARPVWIAASTHPEEEVPVLALHARLRQAIPDLLLLWAPRHPERFRSVAQQAREAGWRVACRSVDTLPDHTDDVFVIDSLGELLRFYAASDVAFVGGSLQAIGGHNLLEPAAMGAAIVTGPHLHNFADIAKQLREVEGLRIGADADAVGEALLALLRAPDARARQAQQAKQLLEDGRGALLRTLQAIAADLPPVSS